MENQRRNLTTQRSWEEAPIDDYVNDVRIVWGHHDEERSVIDVWLWVVQHASELGELVRRGKLDGAQDQLGRIAIWMLTFAAKGLGSLRGRETVFRLTKPLSQILWTKYPNCCHACFTRRVVRGGETWKGDITECDCISTLAETEDRDRLLTPEEKTEAKRQRRQYADTFWEQEKTDYQSLSLRKLEERFEKMFRRSIFALDLEHVTFHFLEEVGEVTEALTHLYTYKVDKDTPPESLSGQWRERLPDLEDELGDSFSWLFSVSSKLRDVFKMFDSAAKVTDLARQMYVAEHLKKRHMREIDSLMKCYDCGAHQCTCRIKLITDDESAEKLAQDR